MPHTSVPQIQNRRIYHRQVLMQLSVWGVLQYIRHWTLDSQFDFDFGKVDNSLSSSFDQMFIEFIPICQEILSCCQLSVDRFPPSGHNQLCSQFSIDRLHTLGHNQLCSQFSLERLPTSEHNQLCSQLSVDRFPTSEHNQLCSYFSVDRFLPQNIISCVVS